MCGFFNFFKFYLFIYGHAGSSLLAHGLSLVVTSQGHSLIAVYGFLIAADSLAAEHGLRGMWAQ